MIGYNDFSGVGETGILRGLVGRPVVGFELTMRRESEKDLRVGMRSFMISQFQK